MAGFLSGFLILILFLSPIIFSLMPTPFLVAPLRGVYWPIIYFVFLSAIVVAKKLPKTNKIETVFSFSIPVVLLITYLLLTFPPSPLIAKGLLALVAGIVGMYIGISRNLKAAGILSLLVTLSAFFGLEVYLRSVPPENFQAGILKVPPLVPPDRGNIVFQKNGFRGERPCADCPKETIRIVTTGGSSTFGIPMYYSEDTYSAKLQRILDARRPGEKYEVLNGGIPGYGIMQIVDSLEKEILKFKPQIVSVCAWFNDSSALPSWYGMANKSDKESYEMLKVLSFIERLPGIKRIYNTRTFVLFRFYLLSLQSKINQAESDTDSSKKKKKNKRPRMSPKEFEWGLEQVVALSEKHNFLPVLIYEPLNRTLSVENTTKGKKYYEVVQKIASKYDLPLVDTLKPYAERRADWLFYDFIHPNQAGHEITAEVFYSTLFENLKSVKARNFLESKGVNFGLPSARTEYFKQMPRNSILNDKITLEARAPYAGNEKLKLQVYANNKLLSEYPELGKEFKNFEIDLKDTNLKAPLLDLSVQAAYLENIPSSQTKIGSNELYSPVYLDVKSGGKDYGWTSHIYVNGQSYTSNLDGYSVVVVGAVSGKVKANMLFNLKKSKEQSSKFQSYLKNMEEFYENGKAPIVIVALKTDGFENADTAVLTEAFKSIGGSGAVPKLNHSFLLIGSPGLSAGEALEKSGAELLHVTIGNPDSVYERLIEVKDQTEISN